STASRHRSCMSLHTESTQIAGSTGTQTAGSTGTGSTTSSAATDAEPASTGVSLRAPRITDAARLWQIADESQVLDVNSSYAYLLWCRDFAASSLIAEIDGHAAGFVIGYVRPESPDTLFVWQIAVDAEFRGRGLAAKILHTLLDSVADAGITTLETTISPGNTASQALF